MSVYVNTGPDITGTIEITAEIPADTKEVIKPDKNGIYKNLPAAFLDQISANKTYYDSKYFNNAMTHPESLFYLRLRNAELCGEYGHPELFGMTKKEMIERIMWIEPKYVSHLITATRIKNIPGIGKLVLIDIKPHGPYGDYIEEKLKNPNLNCSFSLRALTKDKMVNGYLYRYVTKLTTFDGGVALGGFIRSSKKGKIELSQQHALEQKVDILPNTHITNVKADYFFDYDDMEGIATEGLITKYELKNVMNYKKIIINKKVIGYASKDTIVLDPNVKSNKVKADKIKSPFHMFFVNK